MSPGRRIFPCLHQAGSEALPTCAHWRTAVLRPPSSEWRSTVARSIRGAGPRNLPNSCYFRFDTPPPSERTNGARIQLRWIADIRKAKPFHVFPRHSLNRLRGYTLQFVNEAVSFPEV